MFYYFFLIANFNAPIANTPTSDINIPIYIPILSKITHAIKRYVKLSYEITSGEDIEMAIKDLSGTHVTNLQLN